MKTEARVLATAAIGLWFIWMTTACMGWISSRSSGGVVVGTIGVVLTWLLSGRLLFWTWKRRKAVANTQQKDVSSGTGSSDSSGV